LLSSAFLTIALATAAFSQPTKRQSGRVITSCTVVFMQNIVDSLDAKGVKSTFFINGCIYGDTEIAALQNAYSKGHQIGSHTWAHKDLATLTTNEVESEFTLTDMALEKIPGIKVAFMRPPYGSYNDGDFDSGDSVGESAANSEKDYDTLVAKHPSTILTLNHETIRDTTVLPHALDVLLGANYSLVTVAECMGQPPYLSVATPSAQDASWTCSGTD
ncbi:glycoside hydrolase/deacetylase, partial [Armillaria gallica]